MVWWICFQGDDVYNLWTVAINRRSFLIITENISLLLWPTYFFDWSPSHIQLFEDRSTPIIEKGLWAITVLHGYHFLNLLWSRQTPWNWLSFLFFCRLSTFITSIWWCISTPSEGPDNRFHFTLSEHHVNIFNSDGESTGRDFGDAVYCCMPSFCLLTADERVENLKSSSLVCKWILWYSRGRRTLWRKIQSTYVHELETSCILSKVQIIFLKCISLSRIACPRVRDKVKWADCLTIEVMMLVCYLAMPSFNLAFLVCYDIELSK